MSTAIAHMDEVGERFRVQLAAFDQQTMLVELVWQRVAEFFARYPGIERTAHREAFIAGLVLEEITFAVAASQSAPAPQTEPKTKVA